MKRILFVDDETSVLQAMQRALFRYRGIWDMRFAASGEEALAILRGSPADVVVSDMRMPCMDGADLLTQVRDEFPEVVRFMLSGFADDKAILRTLPVVQQFLTKPCHTDILRAAIERMCALHDRLSMPGLRALVGRIDNLPSVPESYWELTRALQDTKTDMGALAAIVERDPAMSAKVLQLVNSAFFGARTRVTSIHGAIGRLGTDLLRGLALTAHVFSSGNGQGSTAMSELRDHAMQVAKLASRFVDKASVADAFSAGVVHDIGKLLFAQIAPEQLAAARVRACAEGKRDFEIERAMLGVTQAEVGAYLLGVWGLPASIVEAVAFHHEPSCAPPFVAADVLAALHVANAIAEGASRGAEMSAEALQIDVVFLEQRGLIEQLPRWLAIAASEARRTSD